MSLEPNPALLPDNAEFVIYIKASTESEVLSIYNGPLLAEASHPFTKYEVVERKRMQRREGFVGYVKFTDEGDFTAALGAIQTLPKPERCVIDALTLEKTALYQSFTLSSPIPASHQGSRSHSPVLFDKAVVVDDDDEEARAPIMQGGHEVEAMRALHGDMAERNNENPESASDTISHLKAMGYEATALMEEQGKQLREAAWLAKKAKAMQVEEQTLAKNERTKVDIDANATLQRIGIFNQLDKEHAVALKANLPEGRDLLARLDEI